MKKIRIDLKFLRAIFILLGLSIFIVYALPLFGNILNAGNMFGMVVGIIIIISGVFLKKFINLMKNRIGRIVISTFLVFTIVFTVAFFSTFASIYNAGKYSATNEKTVIVLGCKVKGDTPSMFLRERANVAIEYLKSHHDAIAILTGGKGNGQNISEAQCLYNLMCEAGIESKRLFIEDESTDTEENIENSLKIIEENNLSKNVTIATSNFHQKRAIMICEKNGLTASALPAKTGKYSILTYYTNEVFGVWAQLLNIDGRLLAVFFIE